MDTHQHRAGGAKFNPACSASPCQAFSFLLARVIPFFVIIEAEPAEGPGKRSRARAGGWQPRGLPSRAVPRSPRPVRGRPLVTARGGGRQRSGGCSGPFLGESSAPGRLRAGLSPGQPCPAPPDAQRPAPLGGITESFGLEKTFKTTASYRYPSAAKSSAKPCHEASLNHIC